MAIELTTASPETINNIRNALSAIGYTENYVLSAKGDITTGWHPETEGRFIQDCINGTTSMRWYNIADGDHAELIRAYTGNAAEDTNIERAQIATDWTDLSASGLTFRTYNRDPENFKQYEFKFTGKGELQFIDAFDNSSQYSTIVSHILSSGDGFGYTTLELHPDATRSSTDQYLIIDPTFPNHIHIRAGGQQDNSQAELTIGGENTYFRVGAGTPNNAYISSNYSIVFNTTSDNFTYYNWAFRNDGSIELPSQTSNNRTGFGNTFKFALQGNQHIIASPRGTQVNPTVERLVVAGGDSYQDPDTLEWIGEGGDIYLWAGFGNDGGDIKVDAGNGNSYGGTVKVRAGNVEGPSIPGTYGGFTEIRAGNGYTGGAVSIYGGTGASAGGTINITSGSGPDSCGDVNITASVNNAAKGKVTITANGVQLRYTGVVPGTSKGQAGDVIGDFVINGSYMYYCTANYVDGVADIWKRVAWSNDTW